MMSFITKYTKLDESGFYIRHNVLVHKRKGPIMIFFILKMMSVAH